MCRRPIESSLWVYPHDLYDNDISFHGSMEAETHAHLHDMEENIQDGILRTLDVSICPIRGRKPKSKIRPTIRMEKADSIFHVPCNYSDDSTFGPIVLSIQAGNSEDNRNLC